MPVGPSVTTDPPIIVIAAPVCALRPYSPATGAWRTVMGTRVSVSVPPLIAIAAAPPPVVVIEPSVSAAVLPAP